MRRNAYGAGLVRPSVVRRRWKAVLAILGLSVALGVSCTTDGTASDTADTQVTLAEVHPWLREDVDNPAGNRPPPSYPHTVETADGASVTYHRGPTVGGYPWAVVFHSADGAVEIQELDDAGNVQARTYGTAGNEPGADDALP